MNDNLFDDIRDTFSQFEWLSVLEVALLALMIFWLLRLVRGTTAMTVVRGIGFVVVGVVVLGRALDLEVINWIVNNAFAVLLIFVLIIFQPEFRRGLERVGRAGLRLGIGRGHDSVIIDVVVTVAGQLARRRTGALMVLERNTGLQEIVGTGVRVDAAPTPELLEGIFAPNTPLHDGAVVLRSGRVVAASCTLPLSETRALRGSHLGTRHRAALGISEGTDAVVVVVSEETGAIALAINGRLIRRLDARRLHSLLTGLVQQGARTGRRGLVSEA